MNMIFSITGLPALNARLDKTAQMVAGPITRHALQAGGKIIKDRAVELVRRLTGALSDDIVVVTRIRADSTAGGPGEKYVLIGPGWNPDLYRRVAKNRGASGREVAADQTTNPGVYGYFLEVGHRAPGKGLTHDLRYKRDARALSKQGQKLNTYTQPSSRDYGHLSTQPYPWLEPAFDQTKDRAVQKMADVIQEELATELGGPSVNAFSGS